MTAAMEFLAAAWPLLLVVALAVLLIRGARGPRRRRGRAQTERENGAWARSEWSAGRRDPTDCPGGSGGSSGGGVD